MRVDLERRQFALDPFSVRDRNDVVRGALTRYFRRGFVRLATGLSVRRYSRETDKPSKSHDDEGNEESACATVQSNFLWPAEPLVASKRRGERSGLELCLPCPLHATIMLVTIMDDRRLPK
jgi:hypothetical protein